MSLRSVEDSGLAYVGLLSTNQEFDMQKEILTTCSGSPGGPEMAKGGSSTSGNKGLAYEGYTAYVGSDSSG